MKRQQIIITEIYNFCPKIQLLQNFFEPFKQKIWNFEVQKKERISNFRQKIDLVNSDFWRENSKIIQLKDSKN